MKDAGSGRNKLAPKFSPAVVGAEAADATDVLVTLRAGDPPGPWWLAIQKGFGPVYIEQVGFDAKVEQRHLQSISLLLDGRVSIFGLTAAVDDLSLTFVVASDRSFFDPGRAGTSTSRASRSRSDLGGITLVGGLRKFTEPGPRASPTPCSTSACCWPASASTACRCSAATAWPRGRRQRVRELLRVRRGQRSDRRAAGVLPHRHRRRHRHQPRPRLPDRPVAVRHVPVHPGARPRRARRRRTRWRCSRQYKDTFPIKQGQFWFAGRISFNSFALVDGVAVVAISVGDGFELALLGLARMALPRPQFALVSIELGLICRFSTREGVLWIQAQLTDNSWLLFPEVRLTGGFAFVSWFKGPNRGQFVLTIGGFHPDFHRDGYPVVPRLGFVVDLGVITSRARATSRSRRRR